MASISLDDIRCPTPCGDKLTPRNVRANVINGVDAGTEATLVCVKCGRDHPVCDAEHVETVRFKMYVALGASIVIGSLVGFFGARSSDGAVRIGTSLASLSLAGWAGYAIFVFVSARTGAQRLASLIETSKKLEAH